MSENLNRLDTVVRASIGSDEHPTPESIRERVGQFRLIPGHDVSDEAAEQLCKEIEASLDIAMAIGSVIKKEFAEWLEAEKVNIEPYYWERYQQLLSHKKFPKRVLARLDEVTDRTLGLLENPTKEGPWDRRGMVIGHVQSGKTANYTGLICKAADAGYRLIIVIAGIHNNLRNQTQARIDEGFVGRDSGNLLTQGSQKIIGVGRFGSREFPLTVTNTKQDFNKQTATTLGVQLRALNVPAVLVIKKNASTLRHLNEWLRTHNAQGESNLVDAPMLLIDDEADNASIDISRDPEKASTINSRIRELLAMFRRSCYVGYTATPFANIFIDPSSDQEMLGEDLFPRDFIISLEAPTNYFGAVRIFGEDADPDIIRTIDDNENEDILPIKHKNFHEIVELPPSLLDAARTFIIARAIRLLRGQTTVHNSMLVNVSRFTSVQSEVRDILHEFLSQLVRRIRFEKTGNSEKALEDDAIRELYRVWREEFSGLEFGWKEIFNILLEVIAPIVVIEVNSKSSTSLDYEAHQENGRQVIAVGGFSLSRGLTLEGLTISYFLRNSMMYDTLMQMGRWFGYRPEYEDVCRIWMTPSASGWYEHITESIEELRSELREMERAGLTPEEFGLKVRSHPDTLIVTARNKMGSAESFRVRIGLSNEFIETHALPADQGSSDSNIKAVQNLVADVSVGEGVVESKEGGSIIWRNVTSENIKNFLSAWHNQPQSLHTATAPVIEYIDRRNPGELATWNVALIGVESGKGQVTEAVGRKIQCQIRTVSKDKFTRGCIYVSNKNRISSRGVEKVGLATGAIQKAEEWWNEEAAASNKSPKNVPDRAYRRVRENPLLILHLLDLEKPDSNVGGELILPKNPVAAWGISFPVSKDKDPTVEYVVNTTWMREAFVNDIDEEDEENENDA